MTDLLDLAAELVDIPSESHHEAALADRLESDLRSLGRLDVRRRGDNVVARTDLGRPLRLVLAGHTDTVPVNGNAGARVEGDVLHGLGASDMKAGLAVFLALARDVAEPAVDLTWVFYAGEEVEARHNGLGHLFRDAPDLVVGDAAVVGEPSLGQIEAGCQGTLRAAVTLVGERAHTARPWMGRNAIHRLGEVLGAVSAYEPRRVRIGHLEYREALQAVKVEGGVAGNVVPDRAVVHLNHRFAPDRPLHRAVEEVAGVLGHLVDEDGDELELLDHAEGALPGLDHPLLATLVDRARLRVEPKLGWTDVARFAANGIPACNLGPGDPTYAHTRDEQVERRPMELTYAALRDLLEHGPDPDPVPT